MPVFQFHILPFQQEFPLQACGEVGNGKAEYGRQQGPYAIDGKNPVKVIYAPLRIHHDVPADKVGGNDGHHQL